MALQIIARPSSASSSNSNGGKLINQSINQLIDDQSIFRYRRRLVE